jgi:uncharacterized membrane protein YqjE
MEMVWVSLLLFLSVSVWALVKVLQLAMAWKTIQELEKSRERLELEMMKGMDSELAQLLEKWKAQE